MRATNLMSIYINYKIRLSEKKENSIFGSLFIL